MVFYMEGSSQGGILAEYTINSICEAVQRPLRNANPGDYFVIRESHAPAVIVECGFLSNSDDENNLLSEQYRSLLAQGIANGICDFFNSRCNRIDNSSMPST